MFFPEIRKKFTELVPEQYQDDPRPYYIEQLLESNEGNPELSKRRWQRESALLTLLPRQDDLYVWSDTTSLLMNKLFLWYEKDRYFLEEWQLLAEDNLKKITHLPCVIINGRYDMVCPPVTAWELHKKRPWSELHIIQDAGHLWSEPSIYAKIIEVAEQFAQKFA